MTPLTISENDLSPKSRELLQELRSYAPVASSGVAKDETNGFIAWINYCGRDYGGNWNRVSENKDTAVASLHFAIEKHIQNTLALGEDKEETT